MKNFGWIEESTNTEKELIETYRKMKRIYPDDDFMLVNPKNYQGYNTQTGHRVVLKVWEVLENES